MAVSAAVVAAAVGFPAMAEAAVTDPVAVTLNGSDVAAAAKNVNGLTFKGFGLLSGNSTSALLMDYKSQHPDQYWQLIQTFFGGSNPIMNTVKIEMGNDRNTSTGPEASTMRSRAEYPNVQREPGFQLAADAQKVATGTVHVSILRWDRPTWVATDADQYIWFKNTVLAVYREYGIMVDSINPDTNETGSPNISLYKTFSGWLRNDTKGYEGATADDPNNGFKSAQEEQLFHSIKTIAADTVGTPPLSFGNAMTATDPSLRDAVDVVGFHYSSADDSNGNMKKLAQQFDKEVWNSEGQSTFSSSADRPNNNASDEAGGTGTQFGGTNSALEMGNWITTGFAASNRTFSIFQPAIGSFYDGMQYSSKELVSARDPWSGWTYYDGGLDVLAQFTQFATLGWENSDNTAGIWRAIPQASASQLGTGNPPSGARTGGASYTTLAAPDGSDFSTVIVNDSKYTRTYKIAANGLNLGADKTMELWETRAADAGQAYDANYLKPVDEISPTTDGSYTFTVKPFSTLTATTLDHATKAADGTLTPKAGYGNTLPTSKEYTAADGGRDVLDTDSTGNTNGVTDDAYLYADDFDYANEGNVKTYDSATGKLVDSGESYLDSRGAKAKPAGTPGVATADNGATPRYTDDTNGAFESVTTSDSSHGRVMRQQVGPGMAGSAWNAGDPKTTIGDGRWANYTVSSDVQFEATASGQYASIGAREQGGTANGQSVSAAELKVDPTGAWSLMRFGATVASGTVAGNADVAFKTGAGVWNNLAVTVAGSVYSASINGKQITTYTDASPQATGRIQLGSSFNFVDFDNLKVTTVPGYTPYYTQLIDGMHQTSWANTSTPVLQFDSGWSNINGQGMFEYQRTASNSTRKGAAMTYTFTGTGLDIIGTNTGQPTLNVTVDGAQVVANAPTLASGSERTAFELRGLKSGTHTVVISTANASPINVDAVGVITANADSAKVDTTALAAAVAKGDALNGDDWGTDSWSRVSAALTNARAAVADPSAFGLDAEGAAAITVRLTTAIDALVPKDVSPDVRDLGMTAVATAGRTLPKTMSIDGSDLAVTWDAASLASVGSTAELGTFTATGRTTDKTSAGVYQRFSAAVLMVPSSLAYFIDSGASTSAAPSAYAAVAGLYPHLQNAAADQKWDGATAGSTWGYSTAAPTLAAGTPTDWGSSYVGADFNKPVTYHVSLPAGSYNVVGVQAPRAGLTTNIYSKVGVHGGTATTVTAASNGTATPIAQRITLNAPAVVDLEFGTNGTSGYNARLALAYVQVLPRDLGVQGTLGLKDALPDTVTVAGVATAVTWDAASIAQQRTLYGKLSVSGTIGADDAPVVASYEVVPKGLVYFIDSGTNGVASPEYTAVKQSVPTLRNDAVDQVSTSAGQWGYDATGMETKSTTDINDKYSTGLYQDTTKLTYHLPLDAGTYTLTGGFTEWWNVSRSMYQTVSVGGTELAKGSIPLSGTNTPLAEDLTFTLDTPATVDYVVTNEGAGSSLPVISWLAVADVTMAAAPGDVKAVATGDTSIKVTWAPSSPTGLGFTGYRVYDGDATTPVCITSETSCTFTNLDLGSTHTYTVTGVNQLGEGSPSAASNSVTLPEVTSNDGSSSVPGKAVLSSNDGWDTGLKDGTFDITMNMWWGVNGQLFKLYQDGTLVKSVRLPMISPFAQQAVVHIDGLKNGTYTFTGQLTNSKGTTATQPLTVKVTDASPGVPGLSSSAQHADGSFTLSADLWWGTNATSYTFRDGNTVIGSGSLTAATPNAQHASIDVTGAAPGTHAYTVTFTNAAGSATSKPLSVKVR
ncbi:fibronectin type III domain-containing protein [Leifsonia sp. NPDC058230]|uniref:fibronectin type III domain-containing protein n=1 Tax=Leifsonia sp. NPDC058230 TaxID=3346391 RepID=UPI0036DA1E1B